MNTFQLATPNRVNLSYEPEDLEKSKKLIKKLNGVCPLYRTINDFEGPPLAHNTIISQLLFDFDVDAESPNKELEDARRLHEYLLKHKILHTIYFSGRGFHIYVKTIKRHARELMNPREAVKNAHENIAAEARVEPDPKTKDLMRISRLPNTINTKSGLFCIPLLYEQLYLDKYEIENLARTPKLVDWSNTGNMEPIDVKNYDMPLPEITDYNIPSSDASTISDDILRVELPQCILNVLSRGDCGYEERFAIITALRDLCYSVADVKKILKRYLTPDKYRHCVLDEEQVDYLFTRQDLLFPSCRTLKEQGLCIEGCPGQSIYVEV